MRFWKLGLLSVLLAGLMAACGTLQEASEVDGLVALTDDPNGFEWYADWNGRNGLDSEQCGLMGEAGRPTTGWIHWVFNTKGSSTDAKLVLAGTGSGEYAPGEPLAANVWHFYTPSFDLEGLEASILLKGEPGRPGRLVISDWCEGEEEGETLKVTKTAETSFKRVHDWDLAKSVDPERAYLYPGDVVDVTWMLDVAYLGATDSSFVVAGEISIQNISSLGAAATIDAITDDLGLEGFDDIALDCGDIAFPYSLTYGETLTCSYSQDVSGEVEAGDTGTNTVTVMVEDEAAPYVATADWAFDAPTYERNAVVYVWDYKVWDGKTWVKLGSFEAPAGGRITYDERFARDTWSAERCDKEKTKENWAKLTTRAKGFDPALHSYLATSTATLTLVLKCDEPKVEELEVAKTADTSFERAHDWSVEKSVDPAELHLTYDGAGDGTVTWTVDVTYEGYVDSAWNVSGEITITNTGDLAAVITSVDDVLAGTPIDVECGVTFPYTLDVGETLTCSYDEDGYVEGTNVATVTTERDTYSGDAAVTWGAPSAETATTIDVVDIGDVFGTVSLGSVTAPDGDTFTYTKDFAWADYGRDLCGEYTYGNTAKLKLGEKVIDEDDASLKVYVECVEFKGETAWAANANEPLEYRYQDPGNWATYVSFVGFEVSGKTTTLFAGQTIDVGTVTFSAVDEGFVTITLSLSGAWEFADAADNLAVQDYDSAPSGNPAPGLFDHKMDCEADLSTCTIVVPANGYYGVHANVGTWVPVDAD